MTKKNLKLKHAFLNKHIFLGLGKSPDINTSSIIYFSEKDFEIVLKRVKIAGIGIYGIEAILNGEYFKVITFEEYNSYPQNSEWYTAAFEKLKNLNLELKYSASYYVGGNLLNF